MATENTLISVIMPAYNAEKYIGQAIESVIAQTFGNWELLIIDDASSDATARIACDYAERDERIRVYKKPENSGVANSRNLGFEKAGGEWIALLDSDDVWYSEKLEKQLELTKRSGAEIIYCAYEMIDESGNKISDFSVPESADYSYMLKRCVLSCSTVLLARETIQENRFSTEYYHEDYALWLKLLKKGYKATGCTEMLAAYRVAENSRSGDKLRAAKNRWMIFRKAEKLPFFKAVWAFIGYAYYGFVKYRRIR